MQKARIRHEKTELLTTKLSEEELSKYICGICTDIVVKPIHCTGCKKMFCMKCAIMWKSQQDCCPYKCQSPWKITEGKSSGLELRCPYSEKCPTSMPQNLTYHLAECSFAPEQERRALWLKREYMCSKNHRLQFWTSSFDMMVNAECCECGDTGASRSVCHRCKVKYCVNCRPPPSTKTHCPKGHNYVRYQATPTYVCDICGLKAGVMFKEVYDDVRCNFGVCSNCINLLPDKQELKYEVNNYQECLKGHLLDYLPASETGRCDHCQNETRLERVCPTCKTRYCVECKQVEVQTNMKCNKKHRFQEAEQVPGNCRDCGLHPCDYLDQKCNLGLCYDCLQRLVQDASNNGRLVGQYCSAEPKHLLRKYSAKDICADCKKEIFCALVCYSCDTKYCLKCRPSLYKGHDHCGHAYALADKTEEAMNCALCNEKHQQRMECDVCRITLCLPCHQTI